MHLPSLSYSSALEFSWAHQNWLISDTSFSYLIQLYPSESDRRRRPYWEAQ